MTQTERTYYTTCGHCEYWKEDSTMVPPWNDESGKCEATGYGTHRTHCCALWKEKKEREGERV